MKYCEKCGKQLNDEAVFCEGCGVRLLNKADEEKQVFTCKNCGAEYSALPLYCEKCGSRMRKENFAKTNPDLVNYNKKFDVKSITKSNLPLIIVIVNVIVLVLTILFSDSYSHTYKGGEIIFSDETYCDSSGNLRNRANGSYWYFSKTDKYIDSTVTPKYIDGATLNYISTKSTSSGGNSILIDVELPEYLFEQDSIIFEQLDSEGMYSVYDDFYGFKSFTYPRGSEFLFTNCRSLEKIEIPYGARNIGILWDGPGCFKNCVSLESIELPKTIQYIGNYAFKGCESLHSIEMPSELKIICRGAFDGCTSLFIIKLPDKLETIGESAFYGCTSLYGDIEIPDSVTYIGDYAFSGCPYLFESTKSKIIEIGGEEACY